MPVYNKRFGVRLAEVVFWSFVSPRPPINRLLNYIAFLSTIHAKNFSGNYKISKKPSFCWHIDKA